MMPSEMMTRFVVVGLGVVGSSVAYWLINRLYSSKEEDETELKKDTDTNKKPSRARDNVVCLEDLTVSSSLSGDQVETLFMLLRSENPGVVERTVNTISNLAAFTTNQNVMREAGMLQEVMDILCSERSPAIQTSCCQALANLSLNLTNQPVLQSCLPYVVNKFIQSGEHGPGALSILQLLTNMTTMEDYHHYVYPAIPKLLQFSATQEAAVQLQALKVLVNLSCSKGSVETLLHSPVPPRFLTLLQSVPADVQLRAMTFLANVISIQEDEVVSGTGDFEVDSLHAILYDNSGRDIYALALTLAVHSNEDIRKQASRVLVAKTLRYATQD